MDKNKNNEVIRKRNAVRLEQYIWIKSKEFTYQRIKNGSVKIIKLPQKNELM